MCSNGWACVSKSIVPWKSDVSPRKDHYDKNTMTKLKLLPKWNLGFFHGLNVTNKFI